MADGREGSATNSTNSAGRAAPGPHSDLASGASDVRSTPVQETSEQAVNGEIRISGAKEHREQHSRSDILHDIQPFTSSYHDDPSSSSNSSNEVSNSVPIQSIEDEGPDSAYIAQESCGANQKHFKPFVWPEGYKKPRFLKHLSKENLLYINKSDDRSFRFEWREFLGQGYFGKCFKAYIYKENVNACVKMFFAKNIKKALDEVKIVSKLKFHRNICQIYGAACFIHTTEVYIFMELMSGGSMKDLMQKFCEDRRAIRMKAIRGWIIQVFCGVVFLHNHGIIHYDIKSDNVFVDIEYDRIRVCLGDFGNAKTCDCNCRDNSGRNECDVFRRGRAIDIYGIGGLLFELTFVPNEKPSEQNSKARLHMIKMRSARCSEFYKNLCLACRGIGEDLPSSQYFLDLLLTRTRRGRQKT